MTKKITFLPSNHKFNLDGNDTILEAALRHGLSPDYGCNSGNCGKCKAKLISGNIRKIKHSDYVYSKVERANDVFLQCAYTADSDLVIEAAEANSSKDIPLQTIPVKLKNINTDNKHIILVLLQTPKRKTLRFLAGQTIKLKSEIADFGQHSIASCPCDSRNIELHLASSQLIENKPILELIKQSRQLKLKGPYSDFCFIEESSRPSFFICDDLGFAPLKSIIEHAIALEYNAPLHLFRFDSLAEKPFMENLCRSWADAFDNFFYDSITKTKPELIQNKLLKQVKDSENPAIYMAGNSALLKQIKDNLNLLTPQPLILTANKP